MMRALAMRLVAGLVLCLACGSGAAEVRSTTAAAAAATNAATTRALISEGVTTGISNPFKKLYSVLKRCVCGPIPVGQAGWAGG